MNQKNRTIDQLLNEVISQEFSGWDFSYLQSLQDEESPGWDYREVVMLAIARYSPARMLDMGTGGGEVLSSLMPLPGTTIATEGWEPNFELAEKRLAPLGVKVMFHDPEEDLPFDDCFFDFVINRHTAYNPEEVSRILKEGGRFITQQVGPRNDADLAALLEIEWQPPRDTIHFYHDDLQSAGLSVISSDECFPKCRIFDIRAIVFYLRVINWAIPEFSLEKDQDRLRKIYDRIQDEGSVTVRNHRFLLEVKKLGDSGKV